MATYRLDHTFECDGDLACRYCAFWHYDDIDGWCCVTYTHEWGQCNFDCYEDRLPDCPLTEVDGKRETCHAVSMDCFGNSPYNTSGLQGNSIVVGCSECGAPWTYGLFRGNQFKHNFKACPMCGRMVDDEDGRQDT